MASNTVNDYTGKVLEGDCGEVLKSLPDESIDLIVTDPPYQLAPVDNWRHGMTQRAPKSGFMGKSWDILPSVSVWRECLRVLKPGAFAFVMCTPRQDSLAEMIHRLAAAGFNTAFTSLYWAYASGFPKALNISKAVDKKLGAKRKIIPPTGGLAGGSGNTVGRFTGVCVNDIPVTPEAKALEGSYAGAQFKPALEAVIVVMKPLSEKTYVEQALKNRKGVTWLSDARIPYQSRADLEYQKNIHGFKDTPKFIGHTYNQGEVYEGDRDFIENYEGNQKGRFPANLLVSDDALNDGKEQPEAGNREETFHALTGKEFLSGVGGFTQRNYYGAVDSFSRYFSLDAWWAERVKRLPKSVRRTFPFLVVPKAGAGERQEGLEDSKLSIGQSTRGGGMNNPEISGAYGSIKAHGRNFHPTVKSLRLMTYLVTLGSREGDVVLDPFLGSGTTALACEMLSRKWIGVELNHEYAEIARARLKPLLSQKRLDAFNA